MQMNLMKLTLMIGSIEISRIRGFHPLKDQKQSLLVIIRSESFSQAKIEEEIMQNLCPLW